MLKQIKKIIPYLLILIAIVGVFGNGKNVNAAEQCWTKDGYPLGDLVGDKSLCPPPNIWSATPPKTNFSVGGAPAPQQVAAPAQQKSSGNPFQDEIDRGCEPNWYGGGWTLGGCILKFVYYWWFQVPSLLLQAAALFFNALTALVLQSTMYTHKFIGEAWGVVRDLSNIFFILILIYIAVKMILNMGGSETKSMVASVVMMAILINFSLFFTRIVIDTSNVLALIFYNKLDTKYIDAKGNSVKREEVPTIKGGAKDVSGSLYEKFNATKLVDYTFIEKLKASKVNNIIDTNTSTLPLGATLGIMIIAGTIMLVAAYTFFSSGIFFLGRIIELWVLMIAAPFAFMSNAVPQLSHIPYGWGEWFKKLMSTAFMAPAFMFFLYLIFKLLETKGFFESFLDTSKEAGWMAYLLGILLPAMIILGMLLKAKALAKQGGGQFGEMAMSAAKMTGMLAGGIALGGGALIGRAGIGRLAGAAAQDAAGIERAKKMVEAEQWDHNIHRQGARPVIPDAPGWKGWLGTKINYAQKKSGAIDHERHEYDEVKKKAGLENAVESRMSGIEHEKLADTFMSNNRSQIEADIIKGQDKNGKDVKDAHGVKLEGRDAWELANMAGKRTAIATAANAVANGDATAAGALTKQGEAKLRKELRKEFDTKLKDWVKEVGTARFDHLKDGATQKVSLTERALSNSTSGTYDPRSLVSAFLDKRDGLGRFAAAGLTAAVALGIKAGFKGIAGINTGSPKGDFLKDMGEIIAESMKHAKIDFSMKDAGGGGGHGPDPHAPSGGGHH